MVIKYSTINTYTNSNQNKDEDKERESVKFVNLNYMKIIGAANGNGL